MQTILGANGIIATELAKELYKSFTRDIRLVSRHPEIVNVTDKLFPADLTDALQTEKAAEGSEIVYLAAGLPYNSKIWKEQWPVVMRNVIAACEKHRAKLVFFDNVYMYGDVHGRMTEETPFKATTKKGMVRAGIAAMVIEAMQKKSLTAMICRAPEFYGPGNTKSGTNSTIIDNIRKGKKPQVLLDDNTLRTLIYTPDAGRATALLGNTPDAYGQTWHLPCDTNLKTARQFIEIFAQQLGKPLEHTILKRWMIRMGGLFNPTIREVVELLYQYEHDYIFDCSKFNARFPEFKVTGLEQGISEIMAEIRQSLV
jgi:nucleoside-diphosphate-sugar epimerase